MITPSPWFKRSFTLDLPLERFPNVVERLRGTPPRLEARLQGLPVEVLVRRVEETWSIQENAGHLADLEPIWTGRLEDILVRRERLRAADLENRATFEAGHNAVPVARVLASFAARRQTFVRMLDELDETQVGLAAVHPRLEQPMRVIDLAYFVAEHDDHHLARITGLMRRMLPEKRSSN